MAFKKSLDKTEVKILNPFFLLETLQPEIDKCKKTLKELLRVMEKMEEKRKKMIDKE